MAGEFDGEHRSPGYWLDAQDRDEIGMTADGDWKPGRSFGQFIDEMRAKGDELFGE